MAHSKRFFLYVLLRSLIFVLFFCQLKDLIKVHNRGKFDQQNICRYHVNNFQSFRYQISIYAGPLLFGPLLRKIWSDFT